MMQIVKPVIGATAITCTTKAGTPDVTSSAGFGSVLAGQYVYGAGIPIGARVKTVTDTSNIILTVNATATSASVSLQFGYFTSLQYAAGDALGFPFALDMKKIGQIVVVDNDKQITAIKGYIWNAEPATVTADNAAYAPSDADAAKIIGYFSLTTNITLSNNTVILSAATDIPLWCDTGKRKFCQLIVVGTPTFTAVDSLTVNFIGE